MTTFAAGDTLTLNLDADDVISWSGKGNATITPASGNGYTTLFIGPQNIGPFGVAVKISVVCATAGSYTKSGYFDQQALSTRAKELAAMGVFSPPISLAVFGDSISRYCSSHSATAEMLNYNSYAGWAAYLSFGKVRHTYALNFGVNSNTTTQMLARVGDVVAARPAICAVLGGINDVTGGISYQTITANLSAIYAALTSAGIKVVAITITPNANATQTQRQQVSAVNSWIINTARNSGGIYLADPTELIVDYSATGATLGDPIGGATAAATAYTIDGLHPNTRMAWAIGKAMQPAISAIVGDRSTRYYNPADIYSASNLFGNFLTNGMLLGTAGTLAGTTTGSVADGWTAQGAGTVTASKGTVTLGNGTTYPTQIITLGASSSVTFYRDVYNNAAALNGASIFSECELGLTSAINAYGISLKLSDSAGNEAQSAGQAGATNYWPTVDLSGVARTPDFTVAGQSVVRTSIVCNTGAGGSATIVVGRIASRPVFM